MDSSVYDAMVRMSQDFKMGTPLIDGQGNWGSIDGDSSAAMRYCVTGDTLINTNQGLIRIDDIVKNSKLSSETDIDLDILSLNNKQNKAVKFFNSGKHPTKEVLIDGGYSIKGSYNHPLLTLTTNENGEPIFYWKTIENLSVGDFVVLDRNVKAIQSKNDKISLKEAKLLGSLVSEGYISEKTGRIGFTNSDTEWLNEMELLMNEIFDLNVGKNESSNNCFDLTVHSRKNFSEIVLKYDLKDKSENKIVPKVVLQSSLSIQAEFLKYLFEGDGTVTAKIRERERNGKITNRSDIHIGYTSKSNELLKQIQIMLLQFGIYSSILKDGNIKRLRITGKNNIILFYENIGFAFKRKQDILEKGYNLSLNNNGFIPIGKDSVPFLKEYVSKTNKSLTQSLGFTNKQKFKKNKEQLKKVLSENVYKCIEDFHSLNYLYLPIVDIKENGEETVYSIKVDSKCHSFVGNGIINHNTECKLKPIALELLKELNKDIVEYMPNFDDTEFEPTILPSILPNLFINGTEGIAVGFRTEIPPHNLSELVDVIIAYIKNPKISFEKILEILPAPDYPTGGIIVNKEEMLDLYKTGEGRVSIRAKFETETSSNGKTNLIVTEIPYTQSGSKQGLIDNIANLLKDKKIDSISDIRDESQGEDVRIVLEVKKGFNPEDVKHILYKNTKLQDNQSCNFLVIDKNTPRKINIKEYISLYLDFQEELLLKKYNILLNKALNRQEVLEGLLKAIDYIDAIIELLRGAKNRESVRKCFTTGDTTGIKFKTKKNEKIASSFAFTETQTNAILKMELQRLINLEADKIVEDKTSLAKDILNYQTILSNKKNLSKIIISNLKEMQKKYGVSRKTKVIDSEIKIIETKVVEEDVQILIDRFGYIKSVDLNSIQRSSEDTINQFKYSIVAKNTDKICIFMKSGQLHQIKVSDIAKGKIKDKGTPLDVICKINKEDTIMYIAPLKDIFNSKILFLLESGYLRFVEMKEYITNRQTVTATKIDNEQLLYIRAIANEEQLLIQTNKKVHKIDLVKMPLHKKSVKGKKVINLKKGEVILNASVNEVDLEVAITKE